MDGLARVGEDVARKQRETRVLGFLSQRNPAGIYSPPNKKEPYGPNNLG